MSQTEKLLIKNTVCNISNEINRQLSFQFFILFSRFEYALKRSSKFLKECKATTVNTRKICLAEPGWNKFSKTNNCKFHPPFSSELSEAVEYFKTTPPKKQLVDIGKLVWSKPEQYTESILLLEWIIDQIKIVRNNLFHGGKFPGEPVSDPSRDQELMKHAITILIACLDLDEDVKEQFLEGIDA